MRVHFLLGNALSFVSVLLLLVACSEPKWAYDTVNSVDVGLWYLAGTGVQYKLINAGVAVDSDDVVSSQQTFTTYSRFCANEAIAAQDPWCQGLADFTRGLTVLALMAAVTGFAFSVMAAMGVRTPTWDGEGEETTLVKPVVCSLLQAALMLPAVVSWQHMVWTYDAQCRAKLGIDDFACISSSSSHLLAIADIPFAVATYLQWRLSHAYYVARTSGRIADGFTLAAKTDNVDEILTGIANGVDIDALGSDGRNALHWACTLSRASICHVLLKKGASLSKKDDGADLNVQDRWGTTPLMLTVVGESRAAAATLVELGADVNARNVFGQTALMLCVEAGKHLFQLGMVFLNAGADLRRQDAQGMTALHYAASAGSLSLLLNMLQLCDDELVDKPNKFGETISELAVLHRQPQVVELLENWRAGNPTTFGGDRAPDDDYDDDDDDDDSDTSDDDDNDNDDSA
ncbi:hypothetical protein PybrP1_001104 [[Pythium] brassicae (nom. inval.)]|nr:hypothetical protein PybrP1_001104 [[Pythium] brassicae (nom. inval.)]